MTEDELFQASPNPDCGWPHEFRAVEVTHAPELSYVVPVEPGWVCAGTDGRASLLGSAVGDAVEHRDAWDRRVVATM